MIVSPPKGDLLRFKEHRFCVGEIQAIYLPSLVIKTLLKVPQPAVPEVAGRLCEEGRKPGLVYGFHIWMPTLSKHLPHILIGQLPAHIRGIKGTQQQQRFSSVRLRQTALLAIAKP